MVGSLDSAIKKSPQTRRVNVRGTREGLPDIKNNNHIIKKNSRQSQPVPTLQHSGFPLFKRFTNKLRFVLDGYLVMRNEHSQSCYCLSFGKSFFLKKAGREIDQYELEKPSMRFRTNNLLPSETSARAYWIVRRVTLWKTPLPILTSTEQYESIPWPIFQEACRFEGMRVFPITSYRKNGEKQSK